MGSGPRGRLEVMGKVGRGCCFKSRACAKGPVKAPGSGVAQRASDAASLGFEFSSFRDDMSLPERKSGWTLLPRLPRSSPPPSSPTSTFLVFHAGCGKFRPMEP